MAIDIHNTWLNFVTLQRRRKIPAAAATSNGESTCSGSETSSQVSSSGDEWEANPSLSESSERSSSGYPFYIGPPILIDGNHLAYLKAEHEPRTGPVSPAAKLVDGRSVSAAPAYAPGWSTADADAMERMILRYGRIARNSKRHVTLLRGGINKSTEPLWKDVAQRSTRDLDTGELISWDVDCQRLSKARVYREIPGGSPKSSRHLHPDRGETTVSS